MRCFYSMLFTSQQKMSKNYELFINLCKFTIYLLNEILPEHEPSDAVNDAVQDLLNAIIKYRKLVKNNVLSEPKSYSASPDNEIIAFPSTLSNTSENSPFNNNKNLLNDTGLNLKQERSRVCPKSYSVTPDNEIILFPSTLSNSPENSPFDNNLKEAELNLKQDNTKVSPVDSAIPDLLFTDHILMNTCQQNLNVKEIFQRKLDVSTSKSYKNLIEEDKESLSNENGENIHKKAVPPARAGRKSKKTNNESVTDKGGLNLENNVENEVKKDGEHFSQNPPGNINSHEVKEDSTKMDSLPNDKCSTDTSFFHTATEEHYLDEDEDCQEVSTISDSDCDRKAEVVSPHVEDMKDTVNILRPLDESYIPGSFENTSKSYKNLIQEDKESLSNENGKNIHKKAVPPASLSKSKETRAGRQNKKKNNESVTDKGGLNLENEVKKDGEHFSQNPSGNINSHEVKEDSTKMDSLPNDKCSTDTSFIHTATEEHYLYEDEGCQEVSKVSDLDCDRKAEVVSPHVEDTKDTVNILRPLDDSYIPDSFENLTILMFKKLVKQVYYCWKCEITIDKFDAFHCHGRRHVHDGLPESYVFLEVCSACKLVVFLPEKRLQQISTFHMKNHKQFSDKELHSSGLVSTKCLELFPFDNYDDVTFVHCILQRKFKADKQTATSSFCSICLICKTYFNNPLEWTYHINESNHFNMSPKADIVSCNACCIVFLGYTKNDIAKHLSADMHNINCPKQCWLRKNNF